MPADLTINLNPYFGKNSINLVPKGDAPVSWYFNSDNHTLLIEAGYACDVLNDESFVTDPVSSDIYRVTSTSRIETFSVVTQQVVNGCPTEMPTSSEIYSQRLMANPPSHAENGESTVWEASDYSIDFNNETKSSTLTMTFRADTKRIIDSGNRNKQLVTDVASITETDPTV